MALTSGGQALAWGANTFGQLGKDSTVSSPTPVPVKLPAGVTVKAIRVGCEHSLALTTTGQVLAWGDNSFGELGVGSATSSESFPVFVGIPNGTPVKAISVGAEHSLALTSTGKVLAWGDNVTGELGNGSSAAMSLTPVRLSPTAGTTVRGLFGGDSHVLALTSKGTVLAWGDGLSGQLGNGAFGNTGTPVQVQLPPALTVTGIGAGPDTASSVAIVH